MRRAFVLVITALLGGCVLLIDPIETSDHCGIQGSGDCASCLRKSCQVPIDRCCANGECSEGRMLGAMDACGRGDTASCADILAAPRIQKEEEELRSCAKASCGTVCTQGSSGTGTDTRPKWTCATSRDSTNVCAGCIYRECKTRIESCCLDSSCASDTTLQTDMAACVSGDVRGCAFILDDERSRTGQAGIVRSCIEESCRAECMGDGLPHTKCEVYAGGDYCQCTNEEISGTRTCRKETVNGDCVLGTDGCTCGQYACSDTSSGCSCSFRGGVTGTTCTRPTDGVCCVRQQDREISCACSDILTSCTTSIGEIEIASCDRADVLAWAGGASVDSCSR